MKHLLFLFFILFVISASAITEQPFNQPEQKEKSADSSNVEAKTYAKDKRGLVLKLLKITGAKKQAEDILKQMTEILPAEARQAFIDPLDPDEMVAQIVPVYKRYLDVDELRAIIEFYETPAGKKLLKAQPKIMEDSMIVMKVYVQNKFAESMNLKKKK